MYVDIDTKHLTPENRAAVKALMKAADSRQSSDIIGAVTLGQTLARPGNGARAFLFRVIKSIIHSWAIDYRYDQSDPQTVRINEWAARIESEGYLE